MVWGMCHLSVLLAYRSLWNVGKRLAKELRDVSKIWSFEPPAPFSGKAIQITSGSVWGCKMSPSYKKCFGPKSFVFCLKKGGTKQGESKYLPLNFRGRDRPWTISSAHRSTHTFPFKHLLIEWFVLNSSMFFFLHPNTCKGNNDMDSCSWL